MIPLSCYVSVSVSDDCGPGVGQDCTPVDACLNSDRGEEPHGEASLHGGAPAAVAQKSHLIRGNGFILER